ncbi:TIM-barrel domain-containing protein [Cellulomonas sp. IC4_254]|uniref:glycoside hydrolase family 31 protein n=1 Tax=Cellulomonas sp. IC4_254 TaxID=2714040 RepID=UPI00321671F1
MTAPTQRQPEQPRQPLALATGPAPDGAADPRAVVQGDRWRVTVLADGLMRLEYAEDGRFEDRPSTFARHRALPVPEFRVVDRGHVVEVVTSRLRLVYDRGPFSTAGLSVEVSGGVSAYHSVWRFGQAAEGLGGTARTLDEADGRVPLEGGVVSRQGYAVLDDSRSMVFEPDGWVAPRDGSRQDLYVFGYAHDHAEALRAFHAVSGPVPVLPRWALGTWWSRFHRYTAQGYREVVERFAAERIPLSVSVLDMDWHVTEVDPALGSGWTGYTWNRDLFPDPPALLSWLHERGLRVTLNVHPADGVRAHEDAYAAMCAALGREPDGDPIAFDVTDRDFLAAYFSVLHRGLERDGVDFWWVDWQQGAHSRVAGIDPLWMLNHFHYLDSARDGRRGLTFSRYAGPGSHRYPVGFSGDTVITWDSLAFQPEFTATAANIGYGWWSHDIGGHYFGVRDEELATRWVQLGTFSPILRLHSSDNPFTSKEPWSFGPHARQVQTAFLRLRHRLVPYLHTMNHRAASSAQALVRPMYHAWPDREEAYDAPQQFLFGSELLVAPVTTPTDPVTRASAVRAWLPPGTWVDVLTGAVYDGDRLLDLHRTLDSVPVLARPGAVVPLDGAEVPGNDAVNPDHLELLVVPGADGAFTLVEDDGAGDGTDPGGVARTPIAWADGPGTLAVGPVEGAAACVPAERDWTLTLATAGAAEAAAGSVLAVVDGAPVPVAARVGEDGRLRVDVRAVPAGARLEVTCGTVPLAGPAPEAEVLRVLRGAWTENALLTRALAAATSDRPLHVRLSHLEALGLPASLLSALREVLLARG